MIDRLALLLAAQAVPVPVPAPLPAPASVPPPAIPAPPPPLLPPAVARSTVLVTTLEASPDHRTLLAAIRTAGIADTLSAPTATTLFAPTDAAFARLAPGELDRLMRPENRAALVRLIAYHVVQEVLPMAELRRRIAAAPGGVVALDTRAGPALSVRAAGQTLMIADHDGHRGYLLPGPTERAAAVVHPVNGLLVPPGG